MAPPVEFDVLIAGGGVVGSALALALALSRLRVGVVEASRFEVAPDGGDDNRVLALSFGSRRVLEALGVWSALDEAATPITAIHVSDRGRFGATRLEARDYRMPALGYVVPATRLAGALTRAVSERADIPVLSPATVGGVRLGEDWAEVEVRHDGAPRTLRSRLLVAADGGDSAVRRLAGIEAATHDFGQSAVVASVTAARSIGTGAFERFTRDGPLALLPCPGGACGLIWTVPRAAAEDHVACDDGEFLVRLGAAFGTRLGRFLEVRERRQFPITMIRAKERVRARLAIVGNAANTLHPVAGQGFNLGLRDAAALAEVVEEAAAAGEDPGGLVHLRRYSRWRRPDQAGAALFTYGLTRVFGSRFPPVVAARGAGLVALDATPGLKRRFARHAMGLGGRLSRLGRGIPPGAASGPGAPDAGR